VTKARAIWRGQIVFRDIDLPVKLYSAVIDRDIHFHLLHEKDRIRLEQWNINPATGRAVEHATSHKAYPIDAGVFVLVDDDELKSMAPVGSRVIQVSRFAPSESIPLEWYDRPYYLGPDSDPEKDYYALAAALESERKSGLARWVMRGREYAGALRAEQGHLLLVTLRHAEDVVRAKDIDAPAGRDLLAEEKRLAKTLVESLSGPFDPSEFHDEYQAKLRALVEAKLKGKKLPKAPKPRAKPEPKSLVDSLRGSLRAMGRS
jgi:DNA end-binding protein Ku